MANSWSVLISIIVITVFSGISWFLSPKGENQTVWRSSLILSAWSCWLLWLITFLAQLYPLESPVRTDLRQQYQE